MIPASRPITHVSDRFAPFASRTIPATVSEAPYLLDGLTMNDAWRRIEEQYPDTGGFLIGDTSGPRISLLRVSFHLSRNRPRQGPAQDYSSENEST